MSLYLGANFREAGEIMSWILVEWKHEINPIRNLDFCQYWGEKGAARILKHA